MSVNLVILVGNLTKEVDLIFTPSGVAVCTFGVATNENYKDRDGNRQQKTEFHNIVIWRQLAEICGKYLKKGSQVYLEGKIQTRSYDDRDGNKKYITEIVCDQMRMLGKREDGNQGYQGSQGNQGQQNRQNQNQNQNQGYGGQQQQQQNSGGGFSEPQFDPSDEIQF